MENELYLLPNSLKAITLSSNWIRKKPCKYFEQGKGTCPFGGKCLYLHAYPDGTRAEPEKPRKQLSSEGTVRVREYSTHLKLKTLFECEVYHLNVFCVMHGLKRSRENIPQFSLRQRFVVRERGHLSFNSKNLSFLTSASHCRPLYKQTNHLQLSLIVQLKTTLTCLQVAIIETS